MMKLSSPRFIQAPIGLDYSLDEFQEMRGKNQRSHHHDGSHYALRKVTTGIIWPQVNNFLKHRDGMSHRDRVLTSLGTIQMTLFP